MIQDQNAECEAAGIAKALARVMPSLGKEEDFATINAQLESSMPTFADVVDAAAQLSADEQQRLLRILRRRIAERNRMQLAGDVAEARGEFVSGRARPATARQMLDEAHRES